MGKALEQLAEDLRRRPRRWLLTGVAGFIGSHLLEHLLRLEQQVIGLDNFSTGRETNLDAVRATVGEAAWRNFSLLRGDITDAEIVESAVEGVDVVLHQAALGSVPRSIARPKDTHRANVDGFVNVLEACRQHRARLVFASSSSVYGDDPVLPRREDRLGRVLSPYALSKLMNEQYAAVYARCYGMEYVALRYFNVFGPRQDPQGAYAAVIPRWFQAALCGDACELHGDGTTSRDFCYIDNVVLANLLAATTDNAGALGQAYNIGAGACTTLEELHAAIADLAAGVGRAVSPPRRLPFRVGDVMHSLADVSKANELLGYQPQVQVPEGLKNTLGYYLGQSP